VLTPTWATVRLFLHVLSVTVWVGGQLTLAGLVPGLRRIAPDGPRIVARRFNQIAWPAYGVAVATGIWNVLAIDVGATSIEYQLTLGVKIAVAALSGVGAALHSLSRSTLGLAVWGAVGGLAAVGAVYLGILLATGA
jgi:putative copper export protein